MSAVVKQVHWKPFPALPGEEFSSQQLFLATGHKADTCVQEVLYHGTRGVGKTEALLVAFAMLCGKGYGNKCVGIIFRKEYKALDDLIKKSKKLFYKLFPNGECEWKNSQTQYKWVWNTGEELLFRSIATMEDYDTKYHGQQYTFIGWEELTTWKDLALYEAMKSCLRSSVDDLDDEDENPVPLLIRSTTNPYGPGRSAVKRYFIDVAPAGVEFEVTTEWDDEIYTSKRMHIFGTFKENVYLEKDYILKLIGLKETDYNKYLSWALGDWNAITGGMFGDYWDYDCHTLDPFLLPSTAILDRSFDYGTASPFSVLWHAELNGESFKNANGEIICPPAGSIIVFNEYYGASLLEKPNVGINLNASKIAKNIKEMETKMAGKFYSIYSEVEPGPADNSIWNDSKVKGLKTIADLFEDGAGIKWERSDKAKGSRVTGVEIFKEMLIATKNKDPDAPWIMFFRNCKFAINNIPNLQVDEKNPEDVDTTQPDHDWDSLKYRILKKKGRFSMFNSFF